jgi:hypothetical protein
VSKQCNLCRSCQWLYMQLSSRFHRNILWNRYELKRVQRRNILSNHSLKTFWICTLNAMFTLLVHLLSSLFQISTTVQIIRAWTMPLASIGSMVTHATVQLVSQEHFVKLVRLPFGMRYVRMKHPVRDWTFDKKPLLFVSLWNKSRFVESNAHNLFHWDEWMLE